MKRIAFLDNTYPQPYQTDSIGQLALGGTESSIIRTANILSSHYHVIVAQKHRNHGVKESETLSFVPKIAIQNWNPDVIVVLRKSPLLKQLRKDHPQAKLFLWLHTYKPWEFGLKRYGLAKNQVSIICNSRTHANHIDQRLNTSWVGKLLSWCHPIRIFSCYNPISAPKSYKLKRDTNQLLFFSSPNKGLDQVLKCFEYVQQHLPELKLLIANPGYKQADELKEQANVKIIGSLAHDQMMQVVAGSLCVFYPQNVFAETFGLIYAEANAYKTPVLGHDIGAAREILHDNNPLVNVEDYKEVLSCIKKWQLDFPQIEYKSDFAETSILQQWQTALGD